MRSCESAKEKVSDSGNKPEEQISQPMRSDLSFSGSVLEKEQQKQSRLQNSNETKTQEDWIVRREGSKVYLKTGEAWYQCQFCRSVGKPMYFATEVDLKGHILALHTGQIRGKYEK
ncbi:MAG: hypothetical protein ACQXXG_09505 [Candidatus Bathyarchaeia archaeon]